MLAPLPGTIGQNPGVPLFQPQIEIDGNATGQVTTYQPAGATYTPGNGFFAPLGTNGRACITCHLPNSAMGLSVANIQSRFNPFLLTDPLFAPVDGATCPSNVPSGYTSGSPLGGLLGDFLSLFDGNTVQKAYYTLLNKGLIRIPRPVPAGAEFTVQVVSDPYGCNTSSTYNQVVNANGTTSQILSVYRRPLMSAAMKFIVDSAVNTGLFPPINVLTGLPLPVDSQGNVENGNIMWDGREPTLASQAIDATLTHAQATVAPSAAQTAQMVAFELGIYSAQSFDDSAGLTNIGGATGGPVALSLDAVGTFPAAGVPAMTMYNAWNPATSGYEAEQRASVYRGQQLFNNTTFTISNVAGVNNVPALANLKGQCTSCHGQVNVGAVALPVGLINAGIAGGSTQFGGPAPATDLPIFKVVCTAGKSTPFNGSTILTNDPGMALTTGKCADIGRFKTPSLRGLAARAPYFSDGSAPTLAAVVAFYNARFQIGLTGAQQQDLINFLATL